MTRERDEALIERDDALTLIKKLKAKIEKENEKKDEKTEKKKSDDVFEFMQSFFSIKISTSTIN